MANHEERCKALALAINADIPAIIWGLPGEGKTAVIEQIARHNKMHCETVIASIHAPEDFKGMPMQVDGRMVYAAPDWAQNIADNEGGLVFLDEISTAPPSTQAALLRPVLQKVAGNLRLPESTRFVAAANPPEIAADGWDLSAPLANRFIHIDWDVDAATVANGFSFGFEDIDLPVVNPEKVAPLFAETKGAVGAFLMSRPDMKSVLPKSSTESGRAWASPRSWEMGAKALAYARAAEENQSVQNILLAGAVGAAAAREFLTWESNLDLPDVEKAIKEGKIDLPDRADKVYMTAAGITRALLNNPTKARMDSGVNKLFVAIADAGHRDVAVVGLRQVGKKFNESKAILSPKAVEHFAAVLQAMNKI
jgi:MoxR-like ATPase